MIEGKVNGGPPRSGHTVDRRVTALLRPAEPEVPGSNPGGPATPVENTMQDARFLSNNQSRNPSTLLSQFLSVRRESDTTSAMEAWHQENTSGESRDTSEMVGDPRYTIQRVVEGSPMLPDASRVPQEARRKLLLVLWERGVKPRDLGVSRDYMYKMRKGIKPVPDRVLERMLEIATDDDLARVEFFAPYVDLTRIRGLDVDRMVRVVVEWARANPASAKVFLDTVGRELERLGIAGKAIKVSEAHIAEFESYLEARIASHDLSPETARDYRAYLREALEELGWVITRHNVRSYVRRLQAESPGKANHVYKALKLFIKEVIQDRELLAAVPRPRVDWGTPEAPTWDEICRVIRALPPGSPPRAFLLILASTGLRVETVYSLPLESLRIEERTLWVWRLKRTKRAYFSFITRTVAEELSSYLRYRQAVLEARGRPSRKLFPYKPRRLRIAIYEAMDRELGHRFPLKQVRKRVAEHLSHHLSTLELQVLLGHAPREVVEKHYLLRDQREELLAKYDEAMSRVPCL